MIRIPWNKYEAAILVEASLQVIEDKTKRKEIIKQVSESLRQMVINQGLQIDDLYRNINGIGMQMIIMISIIEDKKSPLHSSPKMFNEIVNLYKKDKLTFYKILNEAKEKVFESASGEIGNVIKGENDMKDNIANDYIVDFNSIDTLSYTRPILLEICENRYTDFNSWATLYVKVITVLYEKHSSIIEKLKNKSFTEGRKDISDRIGYYSMIAPKKFTNELYIETNLSATDICRKIRSLLGICDILYSDVKIHYIKKNNVSVSKATSANVSYTVKNDSDVEKIRSNFAICKYKDVDFTQYYKILKSKFPRGFRLKDSLDIRKFRRYWNELYNEENSSSNETIWEYIGHITIVHGKMSYLPETMIDDEIKTKLFSYIDETFASGKIAIYYEALYQMFRDDLDNGCINNTEMLKTYLEYTNNGKYFLQRAYITASRHVRVDPVEEVKSYLKSHEVPMTIEDIMNALSHLDKDKVTFALSGNNSYEFVRNQKGEYFHADIIEFTEREITKIEQWIADSILQSEYMSSKELVSLIEKYLPEIRERYTFLTELGLRDTIAYKLRGKFSFKGKIISKYGENLNMNHVFSSFGKNHVPFTIQQLSTLKDDLGTNIYFESLYNYAMRISQTDFVSRDYADFDIFATDDAIEQFCAGDFISLQEISFFGGFPSCGFSWNSFLLEYYVMYFSTKFKLLHTSFNMNSSVGAIVKKNSEIETFDDVIVRALAQSNVVLNTDSALNYLCENGFLARRSYGAIDNIVSKAKVYR